MKAAVLYGKEDLRIEERQIPVPGKGEVLVRIRSAALCGTDLRMWKNGMPDGAPRVLGHEMAGVVEAVGEGVKGLTEGERVAVAPNMGCGTCDLCASGRAHMCREYRALGINLDGAFAEFALVPEDAVRQGNVCALGPSISFDEAAAVEALSCVYNAFESYCVHPGDHVLIIGAGPIGIMHAKLALMAGAAHVMMNDLSGERLEVCRRIEPRILVYRGEDLAGYVRETTRGRGLDVCVTACPSPEAQAASLPLMADFGRVCFFGGLPKDREIVALNTNLIHYRQLVVTGSTRASLSQYRKCLSLIDQGVLSLTDIITNVYAIDEIGKAFAFMAGAGGLKSVIRF